MKNHSKKGSGLFQIKRPGPWLQALTLVILAIAGDGKDGVFGQDSLGRQTLTCDELPCDALQNSEVQCDEFYSSKSWNPRKDGSLFSDPLHRIGATRVEPNYNGQIFSLRRGGISNQRATRFRGNLDLWLLWNSNAADLWSGGEFSVYLQQSHGKSLTQDFVGDSQFYSNLETTPLKADLTQLGEYWYRQTFEEERFSIKMGRQDPNAEFAFSDFGKDFVNSSFLTIQNIPLPSWPTQTIGLTALYQPVDELRLGGGFYDHGKNIGQWWMNSATRGLFLICQMDYPPFGEDTAKPFTQIRIGSWLVTDDTVAVDSNHVFDNDYGWYVLMDRTIFREDADSEQGLGLFVHYSWAPSDRNILDKNVAAGFVYRGLIPRRDEDSFGLGFTLVEFSHALRATTGQTSENAIELFYKANLKDWMFVQPELQYIARPSGIERDALLAGINFGVRF